MDSRSVGVEEEFLLVEPETGCPKAVAGTVLEVAGPTGRTDLESELQQQLETNSRPCQSLLLDHCREALADTGDADTVAGLLTELLTRGNGASFQRGAYRRSGDLTDVIRGVVAVTETGLYRPARRFCRVEALPDGYHECPYLR